MSKLSHEDKIKIYEEIKQGKSIINISKKYNINRQKRLSYNKINRSTWI